MPSSSSKSSNARWWAEATAWIAGGQLIDYLSTRYALAHGSVEGNPFVLWIGLTEAKVFGLILLLAILRALYWRHPNRNPVADARYVFLILCGVGAWNVFATMLS